METLALERVAKRALLSRYCTEPGTDVTFDALGGLDTIKQVLGEVVLLVLVEGVCGGRGGVGGRGAGGGGGGRCVWRTRCWKVGTCGDVGHSTALSSAHVAIQVTMKSIQLIIRYELHFTRTLERGFSPCN